MNNQKKIQNQIYNNQQSANEHLYMSKFLPIFSRAETEIKKLIARFFWEMRNKTILILTIEKYITELDKRIPKNIFNRQAYFNGLRKKSMLMVDTYYTKARTVFAGVLGLLIANQVSIGQKMPKIETPKQLVSYMKNEKIKYNMWSQAKAAVRVQNYPKQLQMYINNLTGEVITITETGRKPISLWQKAELDIRYENQMKMVQDKIDNGETLCWISSHPDCSKRCERWQGKLVSLTEHATMSGFRVKKVDGHWVYSLPDSMDQVDKYGYHNNIINGFNCRHHLINYTRGSVAPKEYENEDVERMRKVNTDLRTLERQIRHYKEQEKLYNSINDGRNAQISRHKSNVLTKVYYDMCKKYGFAIQEYRLKV